MSDIIPFPGSEKKLKEDIHESIKKGAYNKAYDLFEQYEMSFELNDSLALSKCDVLFRLEYFLELREETIILLKKGTSYYDELMIYYVKSLNGLGQFQESVEVINQIINEVKNHKTRMALFPIQEYAKSKLDENKQTVSKKLEQFNHLNQREQSNLVLSMIDNGFYDFKDSIAYIITNISLPYHLTSLMLEYLRFANYNHSLSITKYNKTIDITPTLLKGLENTNLKLNVIPKVSDSLSEDAIHIMDEAVHIMNNHSIQLYPIDIYEIFSEEVWVNGYEVFFKSMLGIETTIINEEVLSFIKNIDSQT